MKIIELDHPWIESPFSTHGFTISTLQQLTQLRDCCDYVYIIDDSNSQATINGSDLQRQAYSNTQTFEEAIPAAKSAHQEAKTVVKSFFNNLRLGQDFEASDAKKAVKECVNSVIANQDAMLWLGLLKNVDEYTARHSLNVGLLSIILGRAEGLSPSDLETVGLCGMLHDMGKAEIPLEILNKEGALSEEEFEIMKSHTSLGYKILAEKSELEEEVANVAHSHHERLNGRGYPRALQPGKISYFSRIVAIADAYDAITSKRVYSPSKTSLDALRILISAKGTHFDPDLVDRFVECIGIYPSGSVAELSNGEIGVVLPSSAENRETPPVLIVRDSNKKVCAEKTIDLSLDHIDDKGQKLKIKHLLSDDAFGIDLKKYHDKGANPSP